MNGSRTVFEDLSKKDIRGDYSFKINNDNYDLKISGTLSKLKTEITSDSLKLSSSLKYENDWMHLMFSTKDTTQQDFIRVNAKVISNVETITGTATLLDGTSPTSRNKRLETPTEKDEKSKKEKASKRPKLLPVSYPNGAYGFTELPKAETILFKNATVWTNESDGILENTDVLVKDGRISKIGTNLKNSKATYVMLLESI